uniref:Protein DETOXIFICATION n=1 Tax=Brassica oleracea var. oleracea TaxID=109376 RepID=A0A0D3EGH1_BRAOL
MGERDDDAQGTLEKARIPLLRDQHAAEDEGRGIAIETWMETKKLWRILGPAIFSRVSTYSIFVITQAFAGHLGELELAAISIVHNVIISFSFGLLLGMASALETLCGQAFGAKKYDMLGVYMQRSWIVLFLFCILLLPMYLFASPILKFFGQPDDIAELTGIIAVWTIPTHFAYAFYLPLSRFLQCQLKNRVVAFSSGLALVVHIFVCWLFVNGLKLGVIGTMATINVSWWFNVFILFTYTTCGGCPLTWTGFSTEAFTKLWEFAKLSSSSGIMICMSINGLEMMIPFAFFAGTGVRVANELGAGSGRRARFAMVVSVTQSLIIGIIFSVLVAFLHDQIGWIFSSSETVIKAVADLSILLAFTILLNSVQPILSGVAVGSGWQSSVAYINLGCYYFIGLPLGFVMGWIFKSGVKGIWAGMIFGGTAIQTLILTCIVMRCDWEKEVYDFFMPKKQMFALRDGLVEMNNALEQYASSASSSTPTISNQVTFYFLVIVKSEDPAMEERADEAQGPLEKAMIPLLGDDNVAEKKDRKTKRKIWMETKKLWRIVGPAIFTRVSTYSIFIITQAFAGHLGELELAAISIVNNVIVGFNYGLLLGMATALETLCGQAFGAKKYDKLGVYLQRSWIVLLLCSILLLPVYFFTSPILKFIGQPDDIAELSGTVAVWAIPAHFSFAFFFPINRFLQSQLKNMVIAISSGVAFVVHIFVCWLFVYVLKLGVIGTIATANVSWWLNVFILFTYTTCGGCPLTWTGFSGEAFTRLWEFTKLSASSGIMLWILIVMTGNLQDAKIAVDSMSIWKFIVNIFIDSMLINGLETMIPLAFFAGTSVRVANELGAGNGGKARFAMIISVIQSLIIGIILSVLVVFLHNQIGWIFSSSEAVIKAVNNLSILLAFTILLNSVYPVLSGAAVGSGWQSVVAYINLGCYYFIGLPLGFVMGWVFNTGVKGIWAGMIFGGTTIQTFILIFITMRCDWENEAQKASMRVKNWQSDARK